MDIPPKVSFYLNIIYGIAVAISTGALKFSGLLPPNSATAVVAYAGVIAFILNIVLHGYSGPAPGPMSKSGKAMGVTLLSLFLLFGFGVADSRAQLILQIPDEPELNYTPIPAPPKMTPIPKKRLALTPHKKPHQGGGAWINPSQFPIPLPPLKPIFSPTTPPTPPPSPIAAILNAVAEAQQTIINDLASAQALATSPANPQTASMCVAPATWVPAQPGTPEVDAVVFNGSIVGNTLTVNSVASGSLAIGQSLSDPGGLLLPGTVITAGSGTTWTVNNAQTDLSIPMTVATTPAVPAVAATCDPPIIRDKLGAMCFPELSNFVATLPGANAMPTVPKGKGGLFTAAEEARLIDFAVKQFASQIQNVGYPDSLKVACDPWLLDYVTQLNIDITKLAGAGLGISGIPGVSGLMNILLLNFIPKPVAAAHGLTGLQETFTR